MEKQELKSETLDEVQKRIDALRVALQQQLFNKEPIDPKRIDELQEMRRTRNGYLKQYHDERVGVVMKRTEELRNRLSFSANQLKLYASTIDSIHFELDRYNDAAHEWAEKGVCPWEDSLAASLANDIEFLANEIR